MKQPKDIQIKANGKNGKLNITIKYSKRFAQQINARLAIVQKVVDSEVLRQSTPYVPMKTGVLTKSALLNSVIGSGQITYATPYARYLYYGIKYSPSYPITKNGELIGFYSPPKKYPTGEPLHYDTSFHPLAGAYWFERMKRDKYYDILKMAQLAANGSIGI